MCDGHGLCRHTIVSFSRPCAGKACSALPLVYAKVQNYSSRCKCNGFFIADAVHVSFACEARLPQPLFGNLRPQGR